MFKTVFLVSNYFHFYSPSLLPYYPFFVPTNIIVWNRVRIFNLFFQTARVSLIENVPGYGPLKITHPPNAPPNRTCFVHTPPNNGFLGPGLVQDYAKRSRQMHFLKVMRKKYKDFSLCNLFKKIHTDPPEYRPPLTVCCIGARLHECRASHLYSL